jgi:hypothetical protein
MKNLKMDVSIIPLLAALLPIIGVNLTYLIASSYEHVPSCFVYLEGCTTISATGRAAPESLWFRALLIPSAVVSMICWRMIGAWLQCLEQKLYRGTVIIQTLGVCAGIFLIVYTVALGFIGPEYTLQRRLGVISFFGLTYLAQLLLARRLWYIAINQAGVYPLRLAKYKLFLCLFLLVVGIASIPISNYLGSDALENIVEWNFAVIVYSYFFLVYWGWKATGFKAELAVTRS